VIACGSIRVVDDVDEQHMTPGQEFRPITDQELKRTSVYAIAIESWSGIFEQLGRRGGAER
jgi:hypothetical protein